LTKIRNLASIEIGLETYCKVAGRIEAATTPDCFKDCAGETMMLRLERGAKVGARKAEAVEDTKTAAQATLNFISRRWNLCEEERK